MKNRSIQVLEAALAAIKYEMLDCYRKKSPPFESLNKWAETIDICLETLNKEPSTIHANEVKLMADKLKFLTQLRHYEFADTTPYSITLKNSTLEIPLCEVRAVRKELKTLIKNTMDRLIKELNDLGVET